MKEGQPSAPNFPIAGREGIKETARAFDVGEAVAVRISKPSRIEKIKAVSSCRHFLLVWSFHSLFPLPEYFFETIIVHGNDE